MTVHTKGRARIILAAFTTLAAVVAVGASARNTWAGAQVQMSGKRGAEGIKGSLEDDEKATQHYAFTLGWADDAPDSAVWEGPFGANNTTIRLVAASSAPQVEWSKGLTANPLTYSGHLVMKIIVMDDKDIPELGLKAGETGYLWIGKRGKGNAEGQGAAIYTIKNNGKPQKAKNMIITGMCYEDHGMRPMAYVRNDDKCKGSLSMPGTSASSGRTFSTFHRRAGPAAEFIGQGLWVTCTGGCCEVKAQT